MTEISIDGQAVRIGSRTYALENIALATAQKSPNLWTGIGMALMGVVPMVILLATGNINYLCLGVLGAGAGIGLLVALLGGSLWWVTVETKQGKRKRIWSAPEIEAKALAEQINAALARESPRMLE